MKDPQPLAGYTVGGSQGLSRSRTEGACGHVFTPQPFDLTSPQCQALCWVLGDPAVMEMQCGQPTCGT